MTNGKTIFEDFPPSTDRALCLDLISLWTNDDGNSVHIVDESGGREKADHPTVLTFHLIQRWNGRLSIKDHHEKVGALASPVWPTTFLRRELKKGTDFFCLLRGKRNTRRGWHAENNFLFWDLQEGLTIGQERIKSYVDKKSLNLIRGTRVRERWNSPGWDGSSRNLDPLFLDSKHFLPIFLSSSGRKNKTSRERKEEAKRRLSGYWKVFLHWAKSEPAYVEKNKQKKSTEAFKQLLHGLFRLNRGQNSVYKRFPVLLFLLRAWNYNLRYCGKN